MSNRFRRMTDLFTVGTAIPLDDGSYLWVQVLNSYQLDECRSDAQVARARVVMAMRGHGDEKLKVEARFYENGRDKLIEDLAEHRSGMRVGDFVDDMREDPDWKERMDILTRSDPDDTAKPLSPEEQQLLSDINVEVIKELGKREHDERDYLIEKLGRLTDEELIEEWTDEYLDRHGTDVAGAEFKLTETYYAARYCGATMVDDILDHSACNGHREQLFASRNDVRDAPDGLFAIVQGALNDMNLVGRDPKDSASAGSSSDSSPTPSAAEESTPSTSTATPSSPPGI